MRKITVLLASVVFAAGLASQAGAVTLTMGSNYTGTLTLTLGALPAISLPANPGATVFYCTSCGTFSEPVGVFGPATIPLPRSLFTGVPQISGLTLAGFGNGTKTGVLFPGPGGAVPLGSGTAVGGLAGNAIINVLQLINLTVPLSPVGQPGASVQAGAGSIIITVIGQGWTTGTATVVVSPGNTITQMGSNMIATGGGLTLVSGFQAITNVAGTLPGFAFQSFAPLPEPATLLLIGAGAAGLVVIGRRRMKK